MAIKFAHTLRLNHLFCIVLWFLLLVDRSNQEVCSQYDGSYDKAWGFMQFRKSTASALKFNVFHQTKNDYMDTFSFEIWFNMQNYDTTVYPSNQHYIYEIENIGSAVFYDTNITITVAGVSTSAVYSNFGMTKNDFYNQWHHLALAYRAYKVGYGIYLWIHIDGIKRAEFKLSAPLFYSANQLGVWVVGNSVSGYKTGSGSQALNTNMRYLTIWNQAWDEISDFSGSIHKEPTPYMKSNGGLQLYHRLDSFTIADYYLLTGRNDQLEFKNVVIGQSYTREFICKCLGEYNNFISIYNNNPFKTMNVGQNGALGNGFMVDVWLKRLDQNGAASNNINIFSLSGLLQLNQVDSSLLVFSPGGEGGPSQTINNQLYKNMWGHYAIKVLPTSAVLYHWGFKVQTFSYGGVGFPSSTSLTISNGFNGLIYSIRLWARTEFADSFFVPLFGQTVHPKLSQDFLNGLLFEVILTKHQLPSNQASSIRAFPLSKTYTNTSIELSDRLSQATDSSFDSILPKFGKDIFLNTTKPRDVLNQTFDYGPCLGYVWDGVACADDKTSLFFPSEDHNNQYLQQNLKGRNRYMTYEVWFKPFRPVNYNSSTIITHSVIQLQNIDFEIAINFNG